MPAFARRLVALLSIVATIATFHLTGYAAARVIQPERISVMFVEEQTPLDLADFASRHGVVVVPELPREAAAIVTFMAEDADQALARISTDPMALAASRVDVVRAQTTDPLYAGQWWLKNTGQDFIVGLLHVVLQATGLDDYFRSFPATAGKDVRWEEAAALSACTGAPCTGQGVLVAVVDSGIDSTHPDLAGRVSPRSRSYVSGFAPTDDDAGHGTFVAGLLGATSNNGVGITGVAPSTSFLALKTLFRDSDGGVVGDSDATAAAILYAADEGARVINLSLGSPTENLVTKAAIERVTQEPYNVVVVAAAGNSGDDGNPIIYPAAFPHVTSVASVNSDGHHTYFSQRNNFVDVAAAGGMVFSLFADSAFDGVDCRRSGTPYATTAISASYTEPYDCLFTDGGRSDVGYMSGSGTSYAAPLVAGAAALAKQKWPTLTSDEFETLVRQTADDDADADGYDVYYGAGTLNIQRLLSYNFPPTIAAGHVGFTAPIVTNSGADTTAVVVQVGNREGASDIGAVTADLSVLGIAQPVTLALDGELTYRSGAQTISANVQEGEYPVSVTVRDSAGATATASALLQVLASGSIIPSLPGGGANVAPIQHTPDLALAVTSPKASRKAVTRKKAITLSGTIGGGVAAVEVNGEPASVDATAKTWTHKAALKEGKNRIEVVSFDVTRSFHEETTVNVVLDRTAPGPVKNLRASATGGKVELKWDAPADSDIAGYHVFAVEGTSRKEIGTSRKTAATVSAQGTIVVIAEDNAGNQGDFAAAPRTGTLSAAFGDVPPGHFAAPALSSLLARGIVQSADQFRPDDAITRAEFAKLLVLARGESGTAASARQFMDVPSSFSLADYVGAAVRLRWASGQGNQFFPNRAISRIEAARMLTQALELEPADRPIYVDITDEGERRVAAAIAKAGIANGQGDRFMPHRPLTRAEAAKMIAKTL